MRVHILKFWTTYRGAHAVDWVEYAGIGQASYSTTCARIADIMPKEDRNDEHVLALWNAVEPAYSEWKKGNEIPETGMALGAWPALTPEQAAVFRSAGVLTVEDVAAMTETTMGRVRLPDVRGWRDLAHTFLNSRDASEAAEAMARKDAEMAELRAEFEAMKAMLAEQPKRRGRPPKDEAA